MYFRSMAEVVADGVNVSDWLLADGLVWGCDGELRELWALWGEKKVKLAEG